MKTLSTVNFASYPKIKVLKLRIIKYIKNFKDLSLN